PPTLTSASSVTGHAWGCSGEDYPFHPRKRWALRVIVSVALAIGHPTPACAGHPALRCLDFPLPEPCDSESGRASSTVRGEYTRTRDGRRWADDGEQRSSVLVFRLF